jgi:hypothetical protein
MAIYHMESLLVEVIPIGSVKDININKNKLNYKLISELQSEMCDGCMKGKMNRKKITGKIVNTLSRVNEKLYADVIGPILANSLGGYRYIMNVVDGYSNEYYNGLVKHKDESTQFIKDKIKMLETQTETKLKEFHTDNGGEFVNDELKELLTETKWNNIHDNNSTHSST